MAISCGNEISQPQKYTAKLIEQIVRFDVPVRAYPSRGMCFQAQNVAGTGDLIMKALCWHGTNDIRCDSVPDPKIEDARDIILKVTSCAICGSDPQDSPHFQRDSQWP